MSVNNYFCGKLRKMPYSFDLLHQCLSRALPFVAFRLPQSDEIRLLVAKEVKEFYFPEEINLSEPAFYIVPFDNEKQSSFCLKPQFDTALNNIATEISEWINSQPQKELNFHKYVDYQTKDNYFQSFEKIKNAIREKKVSKAILSRIYFEDNLLPTKAVACFEKLCQTFPNTYNYLLYLPQAGLWVGATPELLLKRNKDIVETVSLAGTLHPERQTWHTKEFEEQAIVSDYIEKIFSQTGVEKYDKQGPVTVTAGEVSHLKTSYSFDFNQIDSKIRNLLAALHPTPAVCGMPKTEARQLILQTETHHRDLYAGFIGKVETTGDFAFYVNIRCMQFFSNGAAFYVGGGITAASDAQSEYLETVYKAENLRNAL